MPTPGTCRIEQIPDEILVLILLFLPNLAEIARTSILSRRWRNVWHNIACLNYDAATVLPVELLKESHAWRYVACVNKVIDVRATISGLPSVKEFRIWFGLDASQGHHIDRWIGYAIENQVEKLHLDCSPYINNILLKDQYKLSEESWYRAPSGLSSLKYLKSLFLSNVNVSKKFIEFILSSCPLLEDLSLIFAGCYHELTVSGVPPLRLKLLNITLFQDFVLAKLDAPYLTSLTYRSGKFHPQKIDVPMLTDLTIGSLCCPQLVMDYIDHFWSYLHQLEKLELIMQRAERFRLYKKSKLIKLKYLKIWVAFGGCDTIACEIINFINVCPLLETFALEVGEETGCPMSLERNSTLQHQKQELPKDVSFSCLKVLKLHGARVKTLDQEVIKCIVRRAPHLKKLVVDAHVTCYQPNLRPPDLKIVKVLEAKAKELCHGSCSDIEITVIG